ncbi:MAG TPA: hypothetical protein VH021_08125 [Trebonia sp.]|jgi:hypothetical protein|nr:hypothetical protein [Trebonia sp.]
MRVFRRGPRLAHSAALVYVYERRSPEPPYYAAVCKCGWLAGPVEAGYPDQAVEEQMASAASAHDPEADTSVGFPMDKPPEMKM